MREQLAQGGDIAQGVLRELLPDGFALFPDPAGGRFLWAWAKTGLAPDWETKLDASGRLPRERWPRVYDAAMATKTAAGGVRKLMVAGVASSFIATIRSVCGPYRRAPLPQDETFCDALH